MTKAVSNRDICLIKAVLLLCKYWHFPLNFRRKAYLVPNTIRVKIACYVLPVFFLYLYQTSDSGSGSKEIQRDP